LRCLVTGGAGFIGSALVDRLLVDGHAVVILDDLSRGRREFIEGALAHPACDLVEARIEDRDALHDALGGVDVVYHLAANADVRRGLDDPSRDLVANTVGTHLVLEAMRATGVGRLAFASSGAVYGEPSTFPTPEDAPFPVQTSLYGASKAAAEGLIAAHCAGFGLQAAIFRFVSVLGERYHHGHVIDFCRQLADHPDHLHVLGDGRQRKSYLYVGDCVDAVVRLGPVGDAFAPPPGAPLVLNLGTDESCTVTESLGWICEAVGASPAVSYAGGRRGWVGDSPHIHLDCTRALALGWMPQLPIRAAVERTVADLLARGEAREVG
jgi:UDP-glucose 4-epimerase